MTIDLTNLTATQVGTLAILATCLSAGVAALTSYLIARLNTRSAQELARLAMIHEHRKSSLQPIIAAADRSFQLASMVLIAIQDQDRAKAGPLLAELGKSEPLKHLAAIPMIMADPILKEAGKRYALSWNACSRELTRLVELMGLSSLEVDWRHGEALVHEHYHAALNFHLAAEDYICMSSRSQKDLTLLFSAVPPTALAADKPPKP